MTNKAIPYIDNSESMIIPFSSDPQYHYWNGGQSLSDTLVELNVNEDIWRKYINKPYPGESA